jgi:hypothetical protein
MATSCQHGYVVRSSFAVRPPPEVLSAVAALPRPPVERALWALPDQWIVKLRPLGHVPARLHRSLLDAAAAGLDDLATVLFEATEPLVPVTHPQPFQADLVARGRVPAHLAGEPISAEWTVTEVLLIADRSVPGVPRLEDLGKITLP